MNTFAQPIWHSQSGVALVFVVDFGPALLQRLIPQSADALSARSPRDPPDLTGPDQVPAQTKEVCNRLQCSWTITPAKPPGVRSDGEVHRLVGGVQFVPTGLVEFHAMPARPYLRISVFAIHDNSESNF